MKNVEIAEGGIGRRLSGTKFVLTDKPESDQMEVWVDEDDRKLARLYATQNGTYYPEDYDAYGFSSVTVSIHGGMANPDLPNIEMPDGTVAPVLIPEIEMPDGTLKPIDELFPEIELDEVKVPDTVGEEGSAIVGIDPEDGYTYKAEVDENGNLDIEKVPTGIKVIQDPDKKEYTFGEEIDYDGMEIALVDKDGNIVKTKEYPTGTITTDDIDNPEDLPKKTETREQARKGQWSFKTDLDIGAPPVCISSWSASDEKEDNNYRWDDVSFSAPIIVTYSQSNGVRGIFVSSSPEVFVRTTEHYQYYYGEHRHSQTVQESNPTPVTLYGKTAYYGGASSTWYNYHFKYYPEYEIGNVSQYTRELVWAAVYGTMTANEHLHIGWQSPYSGYTYQDDTIITVSDPSEEGDS